MTDHKAKAEEFLAMIPKVQSSQLVIAFASEAQVHATLYLAEQQRIANLIALFLLDPDDSQDFHTIGVSFPSVADQIRDGLGLS